MLAIVPCNIKENEGCKLEKTGKKLISGPIFDPENFFRKFCLYQQLSTVSNYHSMHFKQRLVNQASENREKPNFGPDFDSLGPNLGLRHFFLSVFSLPDVRHCCKLSSYSVSRKTYDPNSRKWQKTSR